MHRDGSTIGSGGNDTRRRAETKVMGGRAQKHDVDTKAGVRGIQQTPHSVLLIDVLLKALTPSWGHPGWPLDKRKATLRDAKSNNRYLMTAGHEHDDGNSNQP